MWNDINTLASTICTAAVLFGIFVLRPMAESFFDHRARQRLRQQKAETLMHGHDPSRLDPDYLEHLQLMRLRDLQATALAHGYDPLKLDPNYEFEEDVKEDGSSQEDQVVPVAEPKDAYQYQYIGYQRQDGSEQRGQSGE